MQGTLDAPQNTANLLAQKRRIVTGWLWRTSTDPRLRNNGSLPQREWVDFVCEIVDFLFAVSLDSGSANSTEISVLSERCYQLLAKMNAAPEHAVLEFSHLRAAMLDNGDAPVFFTNLEQLSVLCDALLAQVIARYPAPKSASHSSQRWRKQPDEDPRQFTLAVVGHELRSLLTPIVTWIDLIARTNRENRDQEQVSTLQHACGGLQRSTRGLKRLVDDLNDYAALTRGKLTMRLIVQDLRALVGDCIESFEPHAKKASIDLRLTSCDLPLMVSADEMRVQQCLTNLLNNTIKFTPAGGTVDIRLSNCNTRGIIEVTDSGKGMLPAELAQLFEPFQQMEDGRNAGGLGLGLALVKAIVELHAGHIKALSAGRDRGTTFRIDLPLLAA